MVPKAKFWREVPDRGVTLGEACTTHTSQKSNYNVGNVVEQPHERRRTIPRGVQTGLWIVNLGGTLNPVLCRIHSDYCLVAK